MKRFVVLMSTLLLSLLAVSDPVIAQEGCTVAVANGSATTDGRPLLWKSRDTDDLDREVRYFDDGSPGGHIATVSTGFDETTTAYAGVNDEGFAIMDADAADLNTGSPTGHGILMKQTTENCGSIAGFESLPVATSGNQGHIWANFGVMDCYGDAAISKTNNWAQAKYAASEGGFVYEPTSHSGEASPGEAVTRGRTGSLLIPGCSIASTPCRRRPSISVAPLPCPAMSGPVSLSPSASSTSPTTTS